MEFCEQCGTILLPRRNKNVLYCKVCDTEKAVDHKKGTMDDYKKKKLSKKSKDQRANRTAIVENNDKKAAITNEEREAYEDFFEVDGEFDYEGGE
jgi:DNA-directed RNA polymerase subunit M/transcription elongation factor TFIIS